MNLDMAQFSLRRRKNPRSSVGALDFPAILTAKVHEFFGGLEF